MSSERLAAIAQRLQEIDDRVAVLEFASGHKRIDGALATRGPFDPPVHGAAELTEWDALQHEHVLLTREAAGLEA